MPPSDRRTTLTVAAGEGANFPNPGGSDYFLVTLKGGRIAEEFQKIVDDYVRATYGGEPRASSLDPERRSIPLKTAV